MPETDNLATRTALEQLGSKLQTDLTKMSRDLEKRLKESQASMLELNKVLQGILTAEEMTNKYVFWG